MALIGAFVSSCQLFPSRKALINTAVSYLLGTKQWRNNLNILEHRAAGCFLQWDKVTTPVSSNVS